MLKSSSLVPKSEAERVGVFESVSPSVAFISTTLTQQTWTGGTSEVPVDAGSGFIWDEEGHIVTNYHVVAGGPSGRCGRWRWRHLPSSRWASRRSPSARRSASTGR